jgi:membrane protein YdbS with pleckstrin-like domain
MLFPTGFILSGLFTEATFLALALMCFYFARKGNWLAVGIAGFFLALSRTVGVLVAVPLLYEYLKARSFNPLRIRPGILWLGLIPLGLGLFMAFNYHLTGDWLAFVHVQRAWQRKLINPLSALKDGLVSPVMCVMFSAWFVLVALAMATIFCRRIGLSYWVLTMLLILIPLSNSLPHMSQMGTMPRYTMAAFPLFILLARLTRNPRLDYAMSAFLAGLQGFLMVFWSVGSPLVI